MQKDSSVSERRAVPQPQESPAPEKFIPEPPSDMISKRAAVNGGGVATARHEVIQTALWKLESVARLNPKSAAAIHAIGDEVAALSRKYYTDVESQFHELAELEKLIRARALTIVGVLEKEHLLDEATATLNSPASLELNGGELLLLQTRTKHLPAVIKGERAQIKEIEQKAIELSTVLGVPIAPVVAEIRRRSRSADGRLVDPEIATCGQYLDFPEPKLPA